VHGHDRFRPARQAPLGILHIDEVKSRFAINEHGARARSDDGQSRGRERIRRHQDLGAIPDTGGTETQLQRIRTVGNSDDVIDMSELAVRSLEASDVIAQYERGVLEDALEPLTHLVCDPLVLDAEVNERDIHYRICSACPPA
jgi:hypothetical protein